MNKKILILDANDVIAKGGIEVLERHLDYAVALNEMSDGNCKLLICGSTTLRENFLKICKNYRDLLEILEIENHEFMKIFIWLRAKKLISLYDIQLDLIIAGDPWVSGLNALILRFCGHKNAKVQIQLHADVFAKGWKWFSFRNFIKFQLARLVIKRAEIVRTVSRSQTKNLIRYLKSNQKVDCIPVSLSIQQNALEKSNREFSTFGFIGRLHSDRGTDLLISIFTKVLMYFPQIRLVIAGSGPEKVNLENKLLKKFPNQVRMLGQISDIQLLEFWQEIDILVSLAEYESYGRAPRESIAMHVPVMALKSSGILDLAESELSDWVSIIDTKVTAEEFFDVAKRMHEKTEKFVRPNLSLLKVETSSELAKSWIDAVMSE